MVNVKLQWYTKQVSDLVSNSLKRMSCSCPVRWQSFRGQVQEHVIDHGVEGTGAYTVFANSVIENLKTTSKNDSHLHRVSDDQGVEFTFDVSWNDLEKCQAKPNSSRNLIASTIRKGAEVSLSQLNQKDRKESEVAKSAEVQSWLRYEAVTAALRSQYHHLDIMKMRWVLRYKECGKPKARLVIIGHHDPRVGSDVRTEALVASRRGRSLFFMATGHNQFSIEMWTSRTRFFRERLTTRHMVNLPQSQFLSCARP